MVRLSEPKAMSAVWLATSATKCGLITSRSTSTYITSKPSLTATSISLTLARCSSVVSSGRAERPQSGVSSPFHTSSTGRLSCSGVRHSSVTSCTPNVRVAEQAKPSAYNSTSLRSPLAASQRRLSGAQSISSRLKALKSTVERPPTSKAMRCSTVLTSLRFFALDVRSPSAAGMSATAMRSRRIRCAQRVRIRCTTSASTVSPDVTLRRTSSQTNSRPGLMVSRSDGSSIGNNETPPLLSSLSLNMCATSGGGGGAGVELAAPCSIRGRRRRPCERKSRRAAVVSPGTAGMP
eukprot:scaffold200406_cov32-Tisochrysis_lutea.AAC.2